MYVAPLKKKLQFEKTRNAKMYENEIIQTFDSSETFTAHCDLRLKISEMEHLFYFVLDLNCATMFT